MFLKKLRDLPLYTEVKNIKKVKEAVWITCSPLNSVWMEGTHALRRECVLACVCFSQTSVSVGGHCSFISVISLAFSMSFKETLNLNEFSVLPTYARGYGSCLLNVCMWITAKENTAASKCIKIKWNLLVWCLSGLLMWLYNKGSV